LTTKILARFKQKIGELRLVPASGGCFELKVDGQLVYSKLETGRFPDEKWAVDAVGEKLGGGG